MKKLTPLIAVLLVSCGPVTYITTVQDFTIESISKMRGDTTGLLKIRPISKALPLNVTGFNQGGKIKVLSTKRVKL